MFAIADRRVHMQCSLTTFAACSNGVCKKSIVRGMHETAKRLLELGLARGAKDFTEIARSLGGSDQLLASAQDARNRLQTYRYHQGLIDNARREVKEAEDRHFSECYGRNR